MDDSKHVQNFCHIILAHCTHNLSEGMEAGGENFFMEIKPRSLERGTHGIVAEETVFTC